MKVYSCVYIYKIHIYSFLTSNLATFPPSFLVPTECSLPPWTIISIMVAVFAVGIALLALVSEITRWIHVSCTHIIKGESVAPR